MLSKTLIFLVLLAVVPSCYASTFCSYIKRVDLNNFQQLPTDELSAFISIDKTFQKNYDYVLQLNFRLIFVQDNDELLSTNLKSYAGFFNFSLDSSDSDIKFSFTQPHLITEKTFKFQMDLPEVQCNITVDFYTSYISEYYKKLSASLNPIVLDETFINYELVLESDLIEATVDLKSVLPELSDKRYQVKCLKCEANLKVSIIYDILQIKGRLVENENALFNDVVVQLSEYTYDEEVTRALINVRLHSPSNKRALIFQNLEDEKNDRVKRFMGERREGRLQERMTPQQQGSANTLKLAISEETVGVQTRLHVYDHEWSDYQLNASDYVKARIRVVAGQNLLNITEPFDFEEGGGMHTFQIIFKRNSNKRPSKSKSSLTEILLYFDHDYLLY